MPTQPSLFAAAPDRPAHHDPTPTLVRERTVRFTLPNLVRARAVRPDRRPIVTFVLEGPHGPLYRGRGRLVDRRVLDATGRVATSDEDAIELRGVVWDDEPVEGASGSITAPWDDDQAWVLPFEIESVTEAPALA